MTFTGGEMKKKKAKLKRCVFCGSPIVNPRGCACVWDMPSQTWRKACGL
jgi:hypothetical protein